MMGTIFVKAAAPRGKALICQNNILQTRVFLDFAEIIAEYKSGDRNGALLSKTYFVVSMVVEFQNNMKL